jgi:hypothetical protein
MASLRVLSIRQDGDGELEAVAGGAGCGVHGSREVRLRDSSQAVEDLSGGGREVRVVALEVRDILVVEMVQLLSDGRGEVLPHAGLETAEESESEGKGDRGEG